MPGRRFSFAFDLFAGIVFSDLKAIKFSTYIKHHVAFVLSNSGSNQIFYHIKNKYSFFISCV